MPGADGHFLRNDVWHIPPLSEDGAPAYLSHGSLFRVSIRALTRARRASAKAD